MLTPEWHADARDGVDHSEPPNWLRIAGLPQSNLPLTHLGKASGRETVVLAHPDGPAVLGARVPGGFVNRLLLTYVPDPDLLVARSRHEHAPAGIPGETLDNVIVFESVRGLAGGDVPELDGEVARSGGEDVLG